MEPIAVEEFTQDRRAEIITAAGFREDELEDLGGFESFVFSSADSILRITHTSHRDRELLMAELEFLDYLAAHGAPVSRPRQLASGEWLGRSGNFWWCCFERAKGHRMTDREWTSPIIERWGEAIGLFHSLASGFEPVQRRFSWLDDPNHDFSARIPEDQVEIRAVASALMSELAALEMTDRTYGLIHGDAHAGNFLIDGQRLTFFDFDDAIYTWYAYDVATTLFSTTLAEHVEPDRTAQEAAARQFLEPFLEGYSKHSSLDRLMLDKLDRFIKLRELSLWGVAMTFFDPVNPGNDYLARFLVDRRRRLEADEPYLAMDFTQLGA